MRDDLWWVDDEPHPEPAGKPTLREILQSAGMQPFGFTIPPTRQQRNWLDQQARYGDHDAPDLIAGVSQLFVAMDEITGKLKSFGNHIHGVFSQPKKQSDYVLFPPPLDDVESIRERALRLQQQPHSMTKRNGYNRKGNKR